MMLILLNFGFKAFGSQPIAYDLMMQIKSRENS